MPNNAHPPQVKEKFLSLGGIILEDAAINSINVYDDMAEVNFVKSSSSSSGGEGEKGGGTATGTLSSRVVIDAIGNGSPIARQIRGPKEPDGYV